MFYESHPIVESDTCMGTLCEDSTKEGRHIKVKQVLPLLQLGTWRISLGGGGGGVRGV